MKKNRKSLTLVMLVAAALILAGLLLLFYFRGHLSGGPAPDGTAASSAAADPVGALPELNDENAAKSAAGSPGSDSEEKEENDLKNRHLEKQDADLQEDDEEERPEEPPERLVDPVIDFAEIWRSNPDCYAYLEIPDTNVSYPIMQSTTQDEDFYLETTFEGQPGYPGSIYTQMISDLDFGDYLTPIYGHNMQNGSFFGALRKYKNPDFFAEHRTIMIYHPAYQFTYQVIAEAVVPEDFLVGLYVTDPESPQIVMDGILATADDEPDDIIAEDALLAPDDKVIVLYTCIDGRPTDRRLVVAKLVERARTGAKVVRPERKLYTLY